MTLELPDTPAEALEDWLPDAIGQHGPWLMFVICLASCVALPVPASVAMIVAGALAATGDVSLPQIALASLAGALIGDQIAFFIGRAGRGPLIRWIDANPRRKAARIRAEDWTRRRGGPGVALSRWPLAPLGPYVNLVAGAAALGWGRFTAWAAPGEVVWVAINIGIGYGLAEEISRLNLMAWEVAGLAVALLVLGALVSMLVSRWRRKRRLRQPDAAAQTPAAASAIPAANRD